MGTKVSKKSAWLIDGISVAVIAVVVVLLSMPNKFDFGPWTKSLPDVIGIINSITTVVLILGFIFIKSKKIGLHRVAMSTAFLLGIVFLVCYVAYHLTNPPNKFGGEGAVKLLYLMILATHILMSLIVLPLVLRAMNFAITGQFERHRKTARFAYPIWLYVSVTGVAVYALVNHLFPYE